MNFLIDAQLPRRLVYQLQAAGYEAIHVFDLPLGNRTPDSFLNKYSLEKHSILVTKDTDFVNSFLISKRPYKLLLIATGNIKNIDLDSLIKSNLREISEGFEKFDFIELQRTSIVFHV
jgi:predicted nuclease of predicted toxin-antitoxin system